MVINRNFSHKCYENLNKGWFGSGTGERQKRRKKARNDQRGRTKAILAETYYKEEKMGVNQIAL